MAALTRGIVQKTRRGYELTRHTDVHSVTARVQPQRRGAAGRRIGLWRLGALAVGGRGRVDARPPPLWRRCGVGEVAARAGANARLEVMERRELDGGVRRREQEGRAAPRPVAVRLAAVGQIPRHVDRTVDPRVARRAAEFDGRRSAGRECSQRVRRVAEPDVGAVAVHRRAEAVGRTVRRESSLGPMSTQTVNASMKSRISRSAIGDWRRHGAHSIDFS